MSIQQIEECLNVSAPFGEAFRARVSAALAMVMASRTKFAWTEDEVAASALAVALMAGSQEEALAALLGLELDSVSFVVAASGVETRLEPGAALQHPILSPWVGDDFVSSIGELVRGGKTLSCLALHAPTCLGAEVVTALTADGPVRSATLSLCFPIAGGVATVVASYGKFVTTSALRADRFHPSLFIDLGVHLQRSGIAPPATRPLHQDVSPASAAGTVH